MRGERTKGLLSCIVLGNTKDIDMATGDHMGILYKNTMHLKILPVLLSYPLPFLVLYLLSNQEMGYSTNMESQPST